MRALLARNGALFATSFLVSGLTNIAAQRFFAGVTGGGAWLGATLLAGTVTSLAAVWLADRLRFGARAAVTGTSLAMALGAASLALFATRDPLTYAALHAVVRALANYLAQECDRRATSLAGSEARAANDQLGSALRFGGLLVGPLWLGIAAPGSVATIVVTGALTLVALASVWSVRDATSTGGAALASAGAIAERRGRLVHLAGVLLYGSYYCLASNALDLVRTTGASDRPAAFAGVVVSTVFASALVATVVLARFARAGVALSGLFAAPFTMLVAGGVLASRVVAPSGLLVGGVLLGVAFALFLLAFRNYASARVAAGDAGWIAVFNNLGNVSALAGFGALLGLRTAGARIGDVRAQVSCGMVVFGVVGALLVALAITGERSRSRGSVRAST